MHIPSSVEYVGTTVLDTIGLVIPGVDSALRREMNLPDEITSLGLISSRIGALGQITACDDAVKSTNTEIISIDLPRDSKGWGGHGVYIVMGAKSVDNARRATEIALELITKYAGEVHISGEGHLEFAYSANAWHVLRKAFDIPLGKAFGALAGSPAAIGLVMADKALKSADIKIAKYMTPSIGTSHTNEVILIFYGHTDAVKEAVLTAKEVGMDLLRGMGSEPKAPSPDFLIRE